MRSLSFIRVKDVADLTRNARIVIRAIAAFIPEGSNRGPISCALLARLLGMSLHQVVSCVYCMGSHGLIRYDGALDGTGSTPLTEMEVCSPDFVEYVLRVVSRTGAINKIGVSDPSELFFPETEAERNRNNRWARRPVARGDLERTLLFHAARELSIGHVPHAEMSMYGRLDRRWGPYSPMSCGSGNVPCWLWKAFFSRDHCAGAMSRSPSAHIRQLAAQFAAEAAGKAFDSIDWKGPLAEHPR